MFDQGDRFGGDPDTMTPLQREFIRLAQIFKARMIAEVELKQRIVERGLIQSSRRESFRQEDQLRENLRADVLAFAGKVQSAAIVSIKEMSTASSEVRRLMEIQRARATKLNQVYSDTGEVSKLLESDVVPTNS